MSDIIKSIYDDQNEILSAIMKLYCPEGYQCDITYGNGGFWKSLDKPKYCFDINPKYPEIKYGNSISLPLESNSLTNIVFDPPFLTYIKPDNKSIMGKRFSGYWTYEELLEHYELTIKECYRILKNKGKLIFKCQDIIHNHKMHCTHSNVINLGQKYNFILKDLFILKANHRMPILKSDGTIKTQKHARIWHNYFLILQKTLNKL